MFECLKNKSSEDKPRVSVSVTSQKLLWCPFAQIVKPEMKTNGKYSKGYPEGCIIHFTAGQDSTEKDALGSLEYGRKMGYAFFVIGPTGVIYQSHPLDRWGSHAGESYYQGLGNYVSQKLVGIEVACAGNLEKGPTGFKSWFGKSYNQSATREVTQDNANQCKGVYKAYTQEQEESLTNLIMWLKKNNPEIFRLEYVLGHDSVAGKGALGRWRKVDPGGSLSMTIPEYQKKLIAEYREYQNSLITN